MKSRRSGDVKVYEAELSRVTKTPAHLPMAVWCKSLAGNFSIRLIWDNKTILGEPIFWFPDRA